MMDLVMVDGRAWYYRPQRVTGKLERFAAHAVVIATGGYGNRISFLPMPWAVTVRQPCSVTARELISPIPLTYKFTPTCIPVHGDKQSKLTLMSESLCVTTAVSEVPKKLEDAKALQAEPRRAAIFLKKTVTIIWNAAIRHSVTLFPATWLHVQPRSVAIKVSVEQYRFGRIPRLL